MKFSLTSALLCALCCGAGCRGGLGPSGSRPNADLRPSGVPALAATSEEGRSRDPSESPRAQLAARVPTPSPAGSADHEVADGQTPGVPSELSAPAEQTAKTAAPTRVTATEPGPTAAQSQLANSETEPFRVKPVSWPQSAPEPTSLTPQEPAEVRKLPAPGTAVPDESVPGGESGESPVTSLPLPQGRARTAGPRPVKLLDPSRDPIGTPALQLEQVVQSVIASFPALEAAAQEAEIAAGRQLAAWGEFDTKLKGESISLPLGFYENYRHGVKVEQAVLPDGWLPGGAVYGGYRIGDGNFPVWYGERETDEGGEFKVGLVTPLLRERAIDQRRADVFQATLRRQQVDPAVRSQVLEFVMQAADAYWSWVAAGLNYDVQANLLRVTQERNAVYERRVALQDLAAIELTQNRRLLASRQAKVIEAERKLQQATIKLSLFLRDGLGQPVLPSPALLPADFPEPRPYSIDEVDAAVELAISTRPELQELDFQRRQAQVDLAYGQNQLLPAVNASLEAGQDIGGRTSSKGDKSPLEVEAGLYFDAPAQRSKARGKIREARGKLNQIAAKRTFTANKIATQVQDALSALTTAYDRVLRATEGLELAQQIENAERLRFDEEDSDLFRVALQESITIEAAVAEIEALSDFFKAEAAYRAAIGADPLTVPLNSINEPNGTAPAPAPAPAPANPAAAPAINPPTPAPVNAAP